MAQRHRHLLIYSKEELPRNQNTQNPHEQSILPSTFEYNIGINGIGWTEYLISVGIGSWPHLTKGMDSASIGEPHNPGQAWVDTAYFHFDDFPLFRPSGLIRICTPFLPLIFRWTHSFFRMLIKTEQLLSVPVNLKATLSSSLVSLGVLFLFPSV